MKEKDCFGIKTLPDDRSIIVVSDLHLGGNEDDGNKIGRGSTAERFCKFLDHLKNCPNPEVNGCNKDKRLLPPAKIILLGDILELWDSHKQDRNNAFLDAILPFRKLQEMDCDVVYVTGNHDEDIVEYITSLKDYKGKQTEKGCMEKVALLCSKDDHKKEEKPSRPESIKFYWSDKHFLEICSRHYPSPRVESKKIESGKKVILTGKNGVLVGNLRYAFVHGHQFDNWQITHPVKETLGRCFDPIDYLQDLANISFSKMLGKDKLLLSILLLAIITLPFIFYYSIRISWIEIPGALTGLFFTFVFTFCSYKFFLKVSNLKSQIILSGLSLFIAFIFLLLTIIEAFGCLFGFGFFISISLLSIVGIPLIFAWVKKGFYNSGGSIKNKLPKEFFKKTFEGERYKYKTEVLIYGHTHKPDYTKETNTEKIKLLVNTGSWIKKDEKKEKENPDNDTFVYIDKDGICCMKWIDDKGKIECFCNDEKKKPLCDYMKEIQWTSNPSSETTE